MTRNSFKCFQSSAVCPIVFNLHLCDPLIIMTQINIKDFVDDNTLKMSVRNTKSLIESRESISRRIFRWFSENLLKENNDKCHVFLSTKQKDITNVDSS